MDHFKTIIPKRPKFIVLQVTFTSKLQLRGTHKWSESNIQNLRAAFAQIVDDVAYPEAAWFTADASLERREQKGHQKGLNEFRLETSSEQI